MPKAPPAGHAAAGDCLPPGALPRPKGQDRERQQHDQNNPRHPAFPRFPAVPDREIRAHIPDSPVTSSTEPDSVRAANRGGTCHSSASARVTSPARSEARGFQRNRRSSAAIRIARPWRERKLLLGRGDRCDCISRLLPPRGGPRRGANQPSVAHDDDPIADLFDLTPVHGSRPKARGIVALRMAGGGGLSAFRRFRRVRNRWPVHPESRSPVTPARQLPLRGVVSCRANRLGELPWRPVESKQLQHSRRSRSGFGIGLLEGSRRPTWSVETGQIPGQTSGSHPAGTLPEFPAVASKCPCQRISGEITGRGFDQSNSMHHELIGFARAVYLSQRFHRV